MKVSELKNGNIRYLPTKGKQLYFANNEKCLYDEIIVEKDDKREVKEK